MWALSPCSDVVSFVCPFPWQLIKAFTTGCRLTDLRTDKRHSAPYLICRLRSLISGLHTVNVDKSLPASSNWMVEEKAACSCTFRRQRAVEISGLFFLSFTPPLSLSLLRPLFITFYLPLYLMHVKSVAAHNLQQFVFCWKWSVNVSPRESNWDICACGVHVRHWELREGTKQTDERLCGVKREIIEKKEKGDGVNLWSVYKEI